MRFLRSFLYVAGDSIAYSTVNPNTALLLVKKKRKLPMYCDRHHCSYSNHSVYDLLVSIVMYILNPQVVGGTDIVTGLAAGKTITQLTTILLGHLSMNSLNQLHSPLFFLDNC